LWNNYLAKLVHSNGPDLITAFWFTPLFFFAVSLISFGIAHLIHKIPFAPKITG